MNATALLVIDMQEDFVRGPMAVPGVEALAMLRSALAPSPLVLAASPFCGS